MDEIFRIIDANFNRVREGLRVVEDGIRFLIEDKILMKRLKEFRHKFTDTVVSNYPLIGKYRRASEDIGKKEKVERSDFKRIIERNLSRIGEGLRSLEEYSKIKNVHVSEKFHNLRFEFYEIEKNIRILINKKKIPVPFLQVILNLKDNRDIFPLAEKVIKGKPDIIQLRYKGEKDNYFLKVALKLRKMIPEDIFFIINDRIDICQICKADGVHLGENDIPLKYAREIIPEKIIGVTCSNLTSIKKISDENPDYISIGAIFHSKTKPEKKVVGLDILTLASKKINIPLGGIGGINKENAEEVIRAGADGVSVISAIENSKNPEKDIKIIKERIKREWTKIHKNSSHQM